MKDVGRVWVVRRDVRWDGKDDGKLWDVMADEGQYVGVLSVSWGARRCRLHLLLRQFPCPPFSLSLSLRTKLSLIVGSRLPARRSLNVFFLCCSFFLCSLLYVVGLVS